MGEVNAYGYPKFDGVSFQRQRPGASEHTQHAPSEDELLPR